MRSLDSITDLMDMDLRQPQETVKDRDAQHAAAVHGSQRVGYDLATKQDQKGHQHQWKDLSVAQTGIISAAK